MSLVAGNNGAVKAPPKSLMAGIKTQLESTPPANIMQEMRGPKINPTPKSSGDTSHETEAPLKKLSARSGTSFHSLVPTFKNL